MYRSFCFWMYLFTVLSMQTTNAGGNTGVVTEIIRGDVVTIGESFSARLTGIYCPAPDSTEIGKEIIDFTTRELKGKVVQFTTWTTDNSAAGIVYDDTGYPFVTINYGENYGYCFNEIMISKGFARVDTLWLPNDRIQYLNLERRARENHIGIWE